MNGWNEVGKSLAVQFNCLLILLHCVLLYSSLYQLRLPDTKPALLIEGTICYRLCSLAYRVNHNTALSYSSKLCVPCSNARLRSTTRGSYMIPRTHRHLANHAFTAAAPSFWNSLPDNVRDADSYSNFLSKLKTHYFNIAFYNHIICC